MKRIWKDFFGGIENHDFNPAFYMRALFKSQRMLSDAVSINLFDISSLVIGNCHFVSSVILKLRNFVKFWCSSVYTGAVESPDSLECFLESR